MTERKGIIMNKMKADEFLKLFGVYAFKERETKEYIKYVKAVSEKKAFPCITIVGQEAGCICELYKALSGTGNSVSNIKERIAEEGRVFITDISRSREAGDAIVSDEQLLKNFDIQLYLTDDYVCGELLSVMACTDFCFVALDANRLLTKYEKVLIDEYLSKMMSPNRLKLISANMDLIVQDSDVEALVNRMKDFADKIGGGIGFDIIDNVDEGYMGNALPAFESTREEEAVIYARSGLARFLKNKLEECDAMMEYTEKILSKCQNNFEKLSRYARYSAGNIKDKVDVQLVYEALKTAEEHRGLVGGEIIKAFDAVEGKDGKKRAEQVERYIKKCWMKFVSDEAEVLEKNITALAEEEKKQLEEDVTDVLSELLPDELLKLLEMLSKTDPTAFPNIDVNDSDSAIVDETINGKRETARKISKGLLFAAIPAAIIVAPATLIATVGGSIAIKKLIVAKMDSEFIAAAKEAAGKINSEMCEEVCASFKRSIQRAGEDVSDWLGGVYSSGKERLMSLIEEYRKSLRSIAENREKIKEMINRLESN